MSLVPAEPQVPNIVTKAIGYLDSRGVKTEGLFRISGAKSRINEVSGMSTCLSRHVGLGGGTQQLSSKQALGLIMQHVFS